MGNEQLAPPAPSNWTEQAHRRALTRLWDETGGGATSTKSVANQVTRTQQAMLKAFPELGYGEAVLTGEWIEYVLGVNLRSTPAKSGEKMDRWGMLAKGAGPRANWGPW